MGRPFELVIELASRHKNGNLVKASPDAAVEAKVVVFPLIGVCHTRPVKYFSGAMTVGTLPQAMIFIVAKSSS